MHPRMFHWARGPETRRNRCGESSCDFGPTEHGRHHHYAPGDDLGGGAFGVRRPLRFLAWKLQLNETQVAEFATLLNELKTERAQAAVDDRRALTAFADAAAGENFGGAKAGEARQLRVSSAERLQGVIVTTLERMHALLDPDQRARLAYLIRTGTLLI
jgi:Spy/CpxP family protein refolding chaperone